MFNVCWLMVDWWLLFDLIELNFGQLIELSNEIIIKGDWRNCITLQSAIFYFYSGRFSMVSKRCHCLILFFLRMNDWTNDFDWTKNKPNEKDTVHINTVLTLYVTNSTRDDTQWLYVNDYFVRQKRSWVFEFHIRTHILKFPKNK